MYFRFEDLTNQNDVRLDSKCDRTVSLFGYVRGAPIRTGLSVHIAGQLSRVSKVPCNRLFSIFKITANWL